MARHGKVIIDQNEPEVFGGPFYGTCSEHVLELLQMDLSVIMCTWNNYCRLAQSLAAILDCEIPKGIRWQLVLVNNNCTDDTDVIAREYRAKMPLTYVREPRQGLSRARNTGLRAASGRLIVFTDDDVKPARSWLLAYWKAFCERPSGYFFGGPVESEFEGRKPDDDLLALAPGSIAGRDWGSDARELSSREAFLGANWACPASTLRAVGQFDERKGLDPSTGRVQIGEEVDLMQRLQSVGIKGWYCPEARLRHLVPAWKCTLRHIGARFEAYGYKEARFGSEHEPGQVPAYMYKAVIWLAVSWLSERLRGRKAYERYLRCQSMIGRIRGLRQRRRDQEAV